MWMYTFYLLINSFSHPDLICIFVVCFGATIGTDFTEGGWNNVFALLYQNLSCDYPCFK